MATVTKPIALDESFHTTEQNPRNIADVLLEGLSHITGRTASEVEYDNTESGLDADNVQDAIDEVNGKVPTLPTTGIQTAVDEFSTYNGGLLSSLKVTLSPNQDLHGYPEPWVGGSRKNKLGLIFTQNPSRIVGMDFTHTESSFTLKGTSNSDAYTIFSLNYLPNIKSNTTYCLTAIVDKGSFNGLYISISFRKDGVQIKRVTMNTGFTLSVPIDNVPEYDEVRFILESIPANTQYDLEARIQIEEGNVFTTFEPYSNICPISGHTQVDVDVSDGQTTQEQVTVNLGGTYYSGTLDVVSGVFTVDSAFIASYNGETLPSTWISDRDVYAVGTTPTTGAEVVYKLATPQSIQLSPTMVKALVGENHLSAPLEGQEITESKYKQMFTFDDVNVQIESTYSEGISHNSFYRGKYLGDHVTDEQWDAIGDGSFRDLYIGDYWAINGINWRIAHFNYWLGTGDVKCNTNHVVIVPYGWVSTFNMNASDDTTGGYLNSEWYTTNRHFAVENIEAIFGASHILSHRNFFSDAVSDGHASHGMWVDSTVDLMNDIMVCGSLVGSYLGKYYEAGCDKFQLALFKYNPPSARMDANYWLRGVSSASSFVAMGSFGLLDGFTASQILKIRPVFAIKK